MHVRRSCCSLARTQAAVLILFVAIGCLSTTTPTAATATITKLNATNYNCPNDCQCTLAQNTHQPFLHAKCTSVNGLKSSEELNVTLPIHSIDLSYLRLPRLSHILEKLPDVTSINLSHNELHEIGHLGRRIKKLNLKHNRITSAKLSKLPQHVQVLNLQHNDITYLPLEMTKLSNLQTLELSHNEINCSCETLEVRNWLQERHVFMEHPVKCSYPVEYKGKSWLQIKQEEVCAKEKRGWHPDEDENELMLGDQPVEGSADNEDEDEFGKAYIPIEKKPGKSNEVQVSEVEGSGDLGEANVALDLGQLTTQGPDNLMARIEQHGEDNEEEMPFEPEEEEPEEEGSGSGGGMLFIPHLAHSAAVLDDFDADTDKHDDEHDSKPIEEPVESAQDVFNRHMHGFLNLARKPGQTTDEPASTSDAPAPESAQDVFNRHMGIFEGGEAETDKSEQTAPGAAADDDDIWPVVHNGDDSETLAGVTTEGALSADKEQIKQAKVGDQDDSNATYFLLGVIGIIVIGLLLYVGIKRCKRTSGGDDDAENPRQSELLDMDKKNLGKPLRNGNEHLPLIGEKSKADMAKPTNGSGKKPYDGNDIKDGPTQQEPLINGNGTKNGSAPGDNMPQINEPEQQQHQQPHEYYPITPRYPTPQSPRASKYAQYPQGEQNNNNPDDTYLPSSPKSGRYSPVYSPETGRVKIKLTETPRPKTPMLVTRSKSNAGDIITTPVANGSGAYGQMVH